MSKKPEGKYEPTLIYTSLTCYVAKVRRFGINKHGNSEDWRTTQPVQHYDAAIRHINAVVDGEDIDAESGLPHLAHAIAGLMFELERKYGGDHANIVRIKHQDIH